MLKMLAEMTGGDTFIIDGNGYVKLGFNTAMNTSTKHVEYFSERNMLVNACKDQREVC